MPQCVGIALSDILILPKLGGPSEHISWHRITVHSVKAAFKKVVIYSNFFDCKILNSIPIHIISHIGFLTDKLYGYSISLFLSLKLPQLHLAIQSQVSTKNIFLETQMQRLRINTCMKLTYFVIQQT